MFDRLRELRKDITEKQGVLVHAVFTSEHLAGITHSPPNAASAWAMPEGYDSGFRVLLAVVHAVDGRLPIEVTRLLERQGSHLGVLCALRRVEVD